MIAEGILKHPPVDAALAMHVTPDIECGKYLFIPGAVTASPSWFTIRVIGKGGHASEPEKCIDPIAAANRIYQHLQQLKPEDVRSVVSTTIFHAGGTQNIIPDEAVIKGTVRTFSSKETKSILKKMEDICLDTESNSGAGCKLEFRTSMGSVYNDETMTRLFRCTVSQYAGTASLAQPGVPFKGGDDFAFISEQVPSVYLFAGVKPHNQQYIYPLHSACFIADECMIAKTAGVLAACALAFLNKIE